MASCPDETSARVSRLDGGADAAHQVYGLALHGDNVVPVAYLSIVQKLLSAVALFLLGLAVQNMLRMR